MNVVNETRNQTYTRLAKLAASSISVSESEIFDLLKISDKPAEDGSLNVGNGVTNDVKVLVKMNRMQGVHVTPTVVFNGVVENSVSSGWTGEQWEEVSVVPFSVDLCLVRNILLTWGIVVGEEYCLT